MLCCLQLVGIWEKFRLVIAPDGTEVDADVSGMLLAMPHLLWSDLLTQSHITSTLSLKFINYAYQKFVEFMHKKFQILSDLLNANGELFECILHLILTWLIANFTYKQKNVPRLRGWIYDHRFYRPTDYLINKLSGRPRAGVGRKSEGLRVRFQHKVKFFSITFVY